MLHNVFECMNLVFEKGVFLVFDFFKCIALLVSQYWGDSNSDLVMKGKYLVQRL